jgi:hypothetical protein
LTKTSRGEIHAQGQQVLKKKVGDRDWELEEERDSGSFEVTLKTPNQGYYGMLETCG